MEARKFWAKIVENEETIRNCCANAHKRLEAVVEAEGGYIEKKQVFCNFMNVLNMNLLNKSFVMLPNNLLMAS